MNRWKLVEETSSEIIKIMKLDVKTMFFVIVLIGVIKDSHEIWKAEKAQPGWFPYQAALYMIGKFMCGGTIISEKHILTAAHCIKRPYQYMTASAGTIYLYDRTAIYRHFKRVDIPRQYFLGNMHYDIAVITLDRSFPLGANISPAYLSDDDWLPCDFCFFAGWGRTANGSEIQENLLANTMIVASHDACKKRAKNLVESHQFCAICEYGITTLDKGDSGGALVCSESVIGVASTREKVEAGFVIFTKIFPHLKFIGEAMSN